MSENLMIAFELLGVGWGGIFVVMIIIYLVSLALSKIFAPRGPEA
ncbi:MULTISPECIES: OadG-related small transporter subunit [Enorma]|nr:MULTISPECIES: OadG-related small transporter subunit [Enorma]